MTSKKQLRKQAESAESWRNFWNDQFDAEKERVQNWTETAAECAREAFAWKSLYEEAEEDNGALIALGEEAVDGRLAAEAKAEQYRTAGLKACDLARSLIDIGKNLVDGLAKAKEDKIYWRDAYATLCVGTEDLSAALDKAVQERDEALKQARQLVDDYAIAREAVFSAVDEFCGR